MKLPDGYAALPGLPRDEDGPVFAEPWQAQSFALTIGLCEAGLFTWAEWVQTLAGVLREAGEHGSYYEHWLTALERISLAKGLTDAGALDGRREAWADAYRRTPHGTPVQLRAPAATER